MSFNNRWKVPLGLLAVLSNLPFSYTQRTPKENLVLADCGIGQGPNGGSTSFEMLYYPGDVWTGNGNESNKPTMTVNVPWSGSYPWGQIGGVSATTPNGDYFTVHINPSIRDPDAAGDAWHQYEIDKPLKCYSYHLDKVYQLGDGKWCSSAYVCNHRGKAYVKPTGDITGVDPSTVKCSDKYINDADTPAVLRWNASGAEHTFWWTALDWVSHSSTTRLSYSEYISNYFHARDMLGCENIGPGPCDTSMLCSEVSQPAGWMILNSFVALHNMQRNIYQALQDALNQMQTPLKRFQDVFSPAGTPESNTWLKDMLNVFQFVVGVGTGYGWNIAFKSSKFNEKYPNDYGWAKDSANGAISTAFTIGKDHLPATASQLQNSLESAMDSIFTYWLDSQAAFLHRLFSGSSSDITLLGSLVKNGLALEILSAKPLDLALFVKEAQKMVYSQMLPLAWKNSSKNIKQQPRSIYPMVLMVPDDCVTSGDALNWVVDDEKSKQIAVCYDHHTFFVGFPTFDGWTSKHNPRDLTLWALPGGEGGGEHELDGHNWGGLTLKDMVISAYEGYKLNGYRNGYNLTKQSGVLDAATAKGNLIMGDGVLTPGFVSLPLCTEGKLYTEARNYFSTFNEGAANTFPCGDGGLTAGEMAQFGFK